MQELTKSQKARNAIEIFKTLGDALALRGYYKPSGKSGQTLAEALKMFSPEIYGTMNDPRIIELKGLEYVIDRLPKGIESCTRLILTAQETFEGTSFEIVLPLKRRRTSYRVSDKEICFVITRGLSEIYDVLTHLTFLHIEAAKISNQVKDAAGNLTREWKEFESTVRKVHKMSGSTLDQAVWNLSIILGRTFRETRDTYEYLEKSRIENDSNKGLFQIIYSLGKRMVEEKLSRDNELLIYFTPSLKEMIGHHQYAAKWANSIKAKLLELGLQDRPIHIISANMHSVVNALYAYAANSENLGRDEDIYTFFAKTREFDEKIRKCALANGLHEVPDMSGAHIDCQLIDTAKLGPVVFHPAMKVDKACKEKKPVILVMDYAFGSQAFEVMDELLGPFQPIDTNEEPVSFAIESISVMGKAGILPGKKGDIMLATAHVLEGTTDNYIVDNDLKKKDFPKEDKDGAIDIFEGPIVTVLGTSLQNRDVLEKFQTTSWKAVGLEMEGGHYQRAISAAIIRGHISEHVKVRYAYYASDNPLVSGQTLASGSMGAEGIRPTYMITKIILEKIFAG